MYICSITIKQNIMKTKFRISQNDTVKAYIYNKNGQLLASCYDSGFTTISQVKDRLLSKLISGLKTAKGYEYSITNENKQTYWTNR